MGILGLINICYLHREVPSIEALVVHCLHANEEGCGIGFVIENTAVLSVPFASRENKELLLSPFTKW